MKDSDIEAFESKKDRGKWEYLKVVIMVRRMETNLRMALMMIARRMKIEDESEISDYDKENKNELETSNNGEKNEN